MNQSQITKTLVVLTLLSGATILIGCGANPDILIPPTAQNAPTSGSPGKTDPSPDFTPHVSADTTTPKSSCVSMNQAIGFEAIPTPPGQLGSPTIDFMTIRFGQIISETPGVPHRSFGQVTMTPVGVGGPYQAPNKQLTTIIDGNVSMDITILPADQIPGYTPKMGPIGTLAKMTGVINLSKSKKDRILAKVAAQFPQMIAPGSGPGSTIDASKICIASVAGEFNHMGTDLYFGKIFLYFTVPGYTSPSPTAGLVTPTDLFEALMKLPKAIFVL